MPEKVKTIYVVRNNGDRDALMDVLEAGSRMFTPVEITSGIAEGYECDNLIVFDNAVEMHEVIEAKIYFETMEMTESYV